MAAYAAGHNRQVEFASGERLFAFALTPVPGEAYVNLYGREITEERRAHLEVLRVKELNESILNSLTNGVLTIDTSLRVTSANPAIQRILGLTPGKILGRSVVDFLSGDSDLAQAVAGCRDGTEPIVWTDRELVNASGLEVSIVFSDIRNFTALSRKLGVRDLLLSSMIISR